MSKLMAVWLVALFVGVMLMIAGLVSADFSGMDKAVDLSLMASFKFVFRKYSLFLIGMVLVIVAASASQRVERAEYDLKRFDTRHDSATYRNEQSREY